MWSEKRALVEQAVKIAKEKHPDGFNKAELIECSKTVNGGFSTDPFKPIKTMEDISNMGNHMANIDGHYPVGMSGCEVVGINGGCGLECPVLLKGDCKNEEEMGISWCDECGDMITADPIKDGEYFVCSEESKD